MSKTLEKPKWWHNQASHMSEKVGEESVSSFRLIGSQKRVHVARTYRFITRSPGICANCTHPNPPPLTWEWVGTVTDIKRVHLNDGGVRYQTFFTELPSGIEYCLHEDKDISDIEQIKP